MRSKRAYTEPKNPVTRGNKTVRFHSRDRASPHYA